LQSIRYPPAIDIDDGVLHAQLKDCFRRT